MEFFTFPVDGVSQTYAAGTTLSAIARDNQQRYAHRIILAEQQEKPGMQTYERSAVFLLLKAFHDVALCSPEGGKKKIFSPIKTALIGCLTRR